jgi:hypothetical protein
MTDQEQMTALGRRMDKGFDEIKGLLQSYETRVRELELQQAEQRPFFKAQVEKNAGYEKQISQLRGLATRQARAIGKLESTVSQHATIIQTLSNALPEMARFVSTLNVWIKWLAGIAATLIGAGLIYFLGRLIVIAITGKGTP